jgi:hypothetical protein
VLSWKVRYVRTAAGARRYGVPIGSPIPTGRRTRSAEQQLLDDITYPPPRRRGELSPKHEAFLRRFSLSENPRDEGGTAHTRIVTDPETGERMVYKRIDDEPELDEPGYELPPPAEQATAEVLGYLIGDALGARVPRVRRLDENALAIDFVDGLTLGDWDRRNGEDPAAYENLVQGPGTATLSVMDYITANSDRNPGNAIVAPDGTIWGIDHSALLDPNNERIYTQFGSEPWERADVTHDLIDEIEPRLIALRPLFERVGGTAPQRHDMLMARFAQLRAEVERRDRGQ